MKIQSIAILFLAVDFAVGGTIRNGSKSAISTGSTDQEEEPDVGILTSSSVIVERALATYGSGSCINGTDVCLRAGYDNGSFLAGDYTCIGDTACWGAGEDGDFEAGNNCCNGLESCYGAGWAASFVVGNSTCIGENSCRYAGSDGASSFTAGDHTCIGKSSCIKAGSDSGGYFFSGSNSCYGDYSCLKAGKTSGRGSYEFVVGNNACRGSSACRNGGYNAFVEIGDNSCVGTDSCRAKRGSSFTIGKNSCRCDECCLYLLNDSYIGDNQCNDISDGCGDSNRGSDSDSRAIQRPFGHPFHGSIGCSFQGSLLAGTGSEGLGLLHLEAMFSKGSTKEVPRLCGEKSRPANSM